MFSSKTHYEPFNNQQYYIDKTEFLEKGMATFPSLYIEGAAASGKTTAVRMFLSRYPDMEYFVLWMDAEQKNPVAFYKKLEKLADRMEKQSLWVIFENIAEENATGNVSPYSKVPDASAGRMSCHSYRTRVSGSGVSQINMEEKDGTVSTGIVTF